MALSWGFAPAIFNTVNKWAAGISDTLALGILSEAYGMGTAMASPGGRRSASPGVRQAERMG